MGRRAVGVVGLAVLLGGCGLAGGTESADYSDHIGTAVVTSTTTTAEPPATTTVQVDSGELYRGLIERSNAAGAGPSTTEAPVNPPYCFAMETFVFESTQMLLQDDLPATLDRYGKATAALDVVIADAPGQTPQLAGSVRESLVTALSTPAATATKEGFVAAVEAMMASGFGAQFDQLFQAMAEQCEADLSGEPYVPSAEGLAGLTAP